MTLVAAAYAFAANARGDVIYVDDSAMGGANDGSSWDNAFIDLQSALAIAQPGDEVRIGQGLYKPALPGGPREATFSLYDGAIVRGGYAGVGTPDPDANDPALYVTTLSGDLNGNDVFVGPDLLLSRADNSLHVVSAHALTLAVHLHALTISGGWASDTEPPHYQGGGIYTTKSVLHLERVTVERNYARVLGGGVQAAGSDQSVLHMKNCLIRENRLPILWSGGAGGGVCAGQGSTFVDCRFELNRSSGGQDAGALYIGSGGKVIRCVFQSNYAEDGGAVAGGGFVMQDCLFYDNWAGYWGSAMWISGPTTLINCTFLGNRFAIEGGAIRHRGGVLNAVNCLFSGNAADGGGAVSIVSHPSNPSSATFTNCTLTGNRSYYYGGGGIVSNAPTLTLNNCVLWGNLNPDDTTTLSAQVSAAPGTLTADFCIIQGWLDSFSGSTTGVNPQLIDADGADNEFGTLDDNARLSETSPARDSGDSAALPADDNDLDGDGNLPEPLPYDLDTHRRIVGTAIDRGCYEFQTCPGDIAPLPDQGDGQVNINDLLEIINAWGLCAAPCPTDVDPSGTVDINDLLAVLLNWGACPW